MNAPGMDNVRQAPAGVVKPPRDIQAIVEKTAGYVARNGPVFEERIRDKEQGNAKFSFLTPTDAYAPFYAWRLHEVRQGRGTAVSAGHANDISVMQNGYHQPQGPSPPAEFLFSARMPNISAQDLEIVRLTALFVATNGKAFMAQLVQREGRNFQFDFLRPQHSLHQFFSRLVDQYTLLLQTSSWEAERARRERVANLEAQSKDKYAIMERARKRAEWHKHQQAEKAKKQQDLEKEQIEFAQIDWHDFVVVETVLFDEADEHAELPAPTSLNDLQSASLEQKAAMSLQPVSRRIEEAMPSADDYGLFYQNPQMAPPPVMPTPPAPAPPPPPVALNNGEENRAIAARTQARQVTQTAQAAAKGISNQPIKIREDYVPRAQAKRQNVATAICPNCKQAIPVNELDHHMKVELLDPRWKEQRMKAESRASTTNLSTSDVANNLKRLASQRSDVFDGVTGALPTVSPEEEARRKRIAATGGFDGHLEGLTGNIAAKRAMAQAEAVRNRDKGGVKAGSIEEQIRLIHERARS